MFEGGDWVGEALEIGNYEDPHIGETGEALAYDFHLADYDVGGGLQKAEDALEVEGFDKSVLGPAGGCWGVVDH